MVKIRKPPLTKTLYVRGLKVDNFKRLEKLREKKGYKTTAKVLDELIEKAKL